MDPTANILRCISNKMQLCTVYLYLENCSTCFGCYFHPSSEAHTTVSTASGICHTVTATCRYRGWVGTPWVTTVVDELELLELQPSWMSWNSLSYSHHGWVGTPWVTTVVDGLELIELQLSWMSWNSLSYSCRGWAGTPWVTTHPRQQQVAVTVWQIPDAIDTVVCAPDDGWK